MLAADLIEAFMGVKTERASLESIATPLSTVRKAAGTIRHRLGPGTGGAGAAGA